MILDVIYRKLHIEENLSIATTRCNLAIAAHGKKMHKHIFWLSIRGFGCHFWTVGEQNLQCHDMSGNSETLASTRLELVIKSEARKHTIAVNYGNINRGRRVRELQKGFN